MKLWRQMILASDAVLDRLENLTDPDPAIAAAHLEATLEWITLHGTQSLRHEVQAAWDAAIVPTSREKANASPTLKRFQP